MLAGVGKGMKYVGNGVLFIGMGCFIIASIMGVLAIDIVILAAILKASNSRSGGGSPFLTGFLLGSLFRPNSYMFAYHSVGCFFLSSVLTTAVACIIALALGVPYVAILLAMVWGAAAGVTLLGLALAYVGDKLSECEPASSFVQRSESNSTFESSSPRHMADMGTSCVETPPTQGFRDNKTGQWMNNNTSSNNSTWRETPQQGAYTMS